MRNDNDITTTVCRKDSNSDVYLHCDSFTPITWERGTLKTLVERVYFICSTPSLLEKELTHIRTVFRNGNGYPNCMINQVVFKEIKPKQRDPLPNSNVSNEVEAAQTSEQTTVEKHDDKTLFLMIPYQGGKGEQVIKPVRKSIKRLLPSNMKVQVSFTGNKLSSCFNIQDKTRFEHRHDVICPGTCPETTCYENYIGEAKR